MDICRCICAFIYNHFVSKTQYRERQWDDDHHRMDPVYSACSEGQPGTANPSPQKNISTVVSQQPAIRTGTGREKPRFCTGISWHRIKRRVIKAAAKHIPVDTGPPGNTCPCLSPQAPHAGAGLCPPYTVLRIPLTQLQLQPVGTSLLNRSAAQGALPAPFQPSSH